MKDKASDGGDPVGYVKRECISRLKTLKHESKIHIKINNNIQGDVTLYEAR